MSVLRKRLGLHQRRCRSSSSFRRAATLVAVLIVMMIVGLLTAQAVRMMFAIRQGDQQRAQLQQARELVELARLTLESRDESTVSNSFEIQMPGGESAEIEFEGSNPVESEESAMGKKISTRGVTRVIARYRSSPEKEFVATKTLTNQLKARESRDD